MTAPRYVYQVLNDMGDDHLCDHGTYLDEATARRYADAVNGFVIRTPVHYDASQPDERS